MSVITDRLELKKRRSLMTISLVMVTLLAIFFYTQVINGGRYRTISEASRAAHSPQ